MAKKKTRKPSEKRADRKGTITPKDLRRHAEILEEQVGQFKGFAQAMIKLKMRDIDIDGINRMDRSIKGIDGFLDTIGMVIKRKQRERTRASG